MNRNAPRHRPRRGTAAECACTNHPCARDELRPTVHGFNEFFGNLHHLDAEEEPERAFAMNV
jgi:hypothetical protein